MHQPIRRAVRPRTAAEKAFCALGPTAEAFITGAAAAGNTQLGPELAELNTLLAAHGDGSRAATAMMAGEGPLARALLGDGDPSRVGHYRLTASAGRPRTAAAIRVLEQTWHRTA